MTKDFEDFLDQHGIGLRLTVPHSPEQNGIAERKNRTLVETARCLLLQSNLPSHFLAEAVHTANYFRNRSPSRVLDGQTAFKLWTGKCPSVKNFRTFGMVTLALDKDHKKGKFDARSKECYFLGYSKESKAYRLWSIAENKIIRSRDVKFLERFRTPNKRIVDIFVIETPQIEPPNVKNNVEVGIEVKPIAPTPWVIKRKRGRPRILKTGRRGRPMEEFNQVTSDLETPDSFQEANLVNGTDPMTVSEAMNSPEAEDWKTAIYEEYEAHIANGTWDIVDFPLDKTPIGARFVFKTKLDRDGKIERRKAGLVAKGFSQLEVRAIAGSAVQ